MVKVYIVILLSVISVAINAQCVKSVDSIDSIDTEMIMFVSSPPVFNGDMLAFIQANLQYPENAKQDSVQGVVFVNFRVDTLGFSTNHKIIRGIRKDIDKAALTVVKLIQFAQPALQEGKPIEVEMTVPVKFILNYKEN